MLPPPLAAPRQPPQRLQAYDTLENGLKVVYAHEFYHMAQWNVLLSTGCPARKWVNVFLEAQAKVASAVQYPELELSREHLTAPESEYSSAAQRFLAGRLEASYAEMEAEQVDLYDAALYWRFLYERFEGMGILRAGLEEMACRPIGEIPSTLDAVMDAALARLNGPMESFEESLIAFAEANYALRLRDGRCAAADSSVCRGRHYDPHSMYTAPPVEAELPYHGSALVYDGSVPSSYGTDLIEVRLEQAMQDQPLSIAFHSEGARFSVQVWELREEGKGELRALSPHPGTLSSNCSAECQYEIPNPNLANANRLALIVVRLDPHERTDPAGAYRLTFQS